MQVYIYNLMSIHFLYTHINIDSVQIRILVISWTETDDRMLQKQTWGAQKTSLKSVS